MSLSKMELKVITSIQAKGHELRKNADGTIAVYAGDRHNDVSCIRCEVSWCLLCIELHLKDIEKCEPEVIEPQIAAICCNCRWFVKHSKVQALMSNCSGTCRNNPPTLYIGADGLRRSGFPDVKLEDFCGQFTAKIKKPL